MHASAIIAPGDGTYTVETIEIGPPGPGEVLVALKAAGLCHTDWDFMRYGQPLIPGHEGAGVIEALGPGVTGLQPGDRVLLNWAIPCGACFQCRRGNQHLCENQPQVPPERTLFRGEPIRRMFGLGTMATHTVVRQEAVTPITVAIGFPAAAIVGCGVMTGYGSVVNAARVQPGSSVAVIGAGGVGLNVIQGARIAGAELIVAVDVNPARLEMAEQFGATHTLHPEADDAELIGAAEIVRELTGGRGADYAFECTAVPALGAAPLRMVRHGGMAVQVSGIEQPITIDMTLFEWNKTYLNPLYGNCRPAVDFPILFALYEQGDLRLDELVTRTYRLEDLGQALADLHAGRNAKGVLVMAAGG